MLIFDDFKVDTEGGEWDVFNDDLLCESILGMLIFDDFEVDTEGGEWDVFNDDLLCAFGRSAADGLPFGQVRA